ncbi:helix-turn-helix transcriptional regulator [Pedobacter africanus]|uniref:helix-turn-helix transcriptional regulator n=1 Tax=Pedobacter africanus TaxID=151894 RepID=UPI00339AC94B
MSPVLHEYRGCQVLIQFFKGRLIHAAIVEAVTPDSPVFGLTGRPRTYGLISLLSGSLTLNAAGTGCTLIPGVSKLIDLNTAKISISHPGTRFAVVYWNANVSLDELTAQNLDRFSVLSAEDQRVLTTSRALPESCKANIYEALLESVIYRAFEQLEDRNLQLEHPDHFTREAILLQRQYDLYFGRPKILRAYVKDRKKQKVASRFRALFDLTPHEYLTRTRLNYAKDLLIRTNLSIQEIAWEIGFESASTLNRKFTVEFQITPTNFRRAFKNKNHPILPNESVKTTFSMPGNHRVQ